MSIRRPVSIVVGVFLLSLLNPAVYSHGKQSAGDLVEEQTGDPGASTEKLTFSAADSAALNTFLSQTAKGQDKAPSAVATEMVKVAQSYVGLSRSNNPKEVAKILQLFNLDSSQPFCAAGVCYVACQAYCKTKTATPFTHANALTVFHGVLPDIGQYYFYPSPAVTHLRQEAVSEKRWRTTKQAPAGKAKPGWLVLYNWDTTKAASYRDQHPQHVGIVVSADPAGGTLHTVEFNTKSAADPNGGAVTDPSRDYKYVIGYIATD